MHGANGFVSEGKKLMHVIATIGASDQLVAIFEYINYRFEPNEPTKLFK